MNRFPVQAPTDVASARRGVGAIAARIGYDATAAGRAAIIVTELAQNLLRHGQGGEILAGPDQLDPSGLEIMALDRGPGMRNVAECMRDGYSTAGTSGNGLGAISRLARQMLVHSRPGAGTAVLARVTASPDPPAPPPRDTAILCVPKPGEDVCGDSAAIVKTAGGGVGLLLADGLGHGPLAAVASREATRLFRARPAAPPAEMLPILHAGLRATRGAALATARIDTAARQVTYGGIGNIAAFIADSAGLRRMVSHSGTAGHTAGRMQTFQYPYYQRPVLIMFSDGLATSWSPDSHTGLFAEDPTIIAGVLYRDHARGRDDASVVVWKG